MDSLADLMKGRAAPQEPEESRLLKAYVSDRYHVIPKVVLNDHHMTLVVPNAALAGTLRLELPGIIRECRITKKLHIRIS
jgi:hypothetical protein